MVRHMKTNIHFLSHLDHFDLDCEMFQINL